MAVSLKGRVAVKEEKRVGDEETGDINKVSTLISSDRSSKESSPRPSSSTIKETLPTSQEDQDQLESTKAEMGEVREENERLKLILARIVKDYQSLQMQFFDTLQQEQAKKSIETLESTPPSVHHNVEELSLRLGTSASEQKKKEERISTNRSSRDQDDDTIMEKGLALGLDCKYEGTSINSSNLSPENSFEDQAKEEEPGEPWPPSKIMKNMRSADDELANSQQTHVKKARVSVRARCDAPTMHDGCQWRKYGQKIAKGNPCPRAYYRCTVAPACPVRKQVQRCAEDMSILITTYEGTHNHPLPISATAMASTTSAAASMLMSGSSSSSRPTIGSPATTPSATSIAAASANLHGLNFGLSDPDSHSRQLYLQPNPIISSNPSYPTITLDLTAPLSSSSQPSLQFNRFPSSFTSNSRYPSTSFNFSSTDPNSNNPASWGNGYLGYGNNQYNKSSIGSLSLGRQSQDPFYQSYLHKATNPTPTAAPTQHSLTDTIAKAITSDPSFQSALAAAITSYVGGQGSTQGGEESLNQNVKWGEQFNLAGSNVNGCATSYLNRSTTANSAPQQGNLLFLQPPLALANSKSPSTSPVDNREKIN